MILLPLPLVKQWLKSKFIVVLISDVKLPSFKQKLGNIVPVLARDIMTMWMVLVLYPTLYPSTLARVW